MRQHRTDAAGTRLEAVESQQRVQPQQAPAALVEALGLEGERRGVAVLQPVGDQQHGSRAGQHAARPVPVELVQASRDARAARPVLHAAHHLRDGEVRVALSQQVRDAREPGAEDEALHPRAAGGDRVREVQQHARVAAHRAGDVGQHDDRRGARAGAAPAHVPQLAAVARHRRERRAPVGSPRMRRAHGAPRAQRLGHQPQPPQRALRGEPLCRAHGLEVGLLQQLALAPRERRVELHLLGRLVRRALRRVQLQRARQPLAFARRVQAGRGLLRRHGGQAHRKRAAEQVGVAPEEMERLVEQLALPGAVDEAGGEHGMEIAPALEPGHLQRLQRELDAVGAHRHACRAQHAREVHDVGGEATAAEPPASCRLLRRTVYFGEQPRSLAALHA